MSLRPLNCWCCGKHKPSDKHRINCYAKYDINAYLEEEALGLHGPIGDAPLTKAEKKMLKKGRKEEKRWLKAERKKGKK